MTNINVEAFTSLYPQLDEHVRRLNFLKNDAAQPRVVVFGKFNHGKSTLLNALLNALLGQDLFAASDARQTVVNQTYLDQKRELIWVDTPGLDADAFGEDDKKAYESAMQTADLILLVHNLKAGELDRYEVDHFINILKSKAGSAKKTLLVLTQIDQVNDEQRDQALKIIQGQLPDLKSHLVSAVRYQKGMATNKSVFVERSGIPELLKSIEQLKSGVLQSRDEEIKLVGQSIRAVLVDNKAILAKKIVDLETKQRNMKSVFEQRVAEYLKTASV